MQHQTSGASCASKTSKLLKYLGATVLLLVVVLQNSCAVDVKDYQQTKPILDLKQFFQGDLVAWGIFQSRNGEVKRSFKVNIKAIWEGDKCYLEERFVYDDGEEEERIWTIIKHSPHHYTGTAGDVVGEARGEAYGNALNWNYTLELPVDDSVYKVQFDDWMYLVDEDTLINKAKIKKFGFRVGDVTLFFRKLG